MFIDLKYFFVVIFACFGLPQSVYAEEEGAEKHFEHNFLGAYLGLTNEGRRDKGLTIGITYERRLNESFGVGATVERVAGDLEFWVAVVPFAYHTGRWKFYAGPGVEKPDNESSEFMLRAGGEYAFEFGE